MPAPLAACPPDSAVYNGTLLTQPTVYIQVWWLSSSNLIIITYNVGCTSFNITSIIFLYISQRWKLSDDGRIICNHLDCFKSYFCEIFHSPPVVSTPTNLLVFKIVLVVLRTFAFWTSQSSPVLRPPHSNCRMEPYETTWTASTRTGSVLEEERHGSASCC